MPKLNCLYNAEALRSVKIKCLRKKLQMMKEKIVHAPLENPLL